MRRFTSALIRLAIAGAILLIPALALAHGSTLGEGLRLAGANPFRVGTGGTVLSFRINHSMKDVNLAVFDVAGRSVVELARGPLTAGVHTYVFSGRGLQAGTYFARLVTEHGVYQKRLMLIP